MGCVSVFRCYFIFLVLYSFVVEFCANVVFSNMRYHIRNGIHRLCVIRFSSSRWKMSSTNKRQEKTIPNRIDHCESIEHIFFFRFYSQSCGKYSYCILSTNFLVYFALAYMHSLLLLVYWVVVLLVVILPFCLLIILVIFVFFSHINMCCFILRNI